MKAKNQHIQCKNIEELHRLTQEYEDYAGRNVQVDEQNLLLTVFALPKNYKKKEKLAAHIRHTRESNDTASNYVDRYTDEYR